MVAELVLEPLQEHPVATAVGQDPRQEEAGQATWRLGQHEEDVAHRRRREPLVADEAVGAITIRRGLSGTRADVRAALLLGHRHAGGDADLGRWDFEFGVVLAAGEKRLVNRGQLGVVAQRRHDRIRHRDRADVAGLWRPCRHLGGANDVRAWPVVSPRRGVQAVPNRRLHQLVVGRVVLDLVDPVPVAVVGVQDRLVAVGELAPAKCKAPLAALADQRLGQYR